MAFLDILLLAGSTVAAIAWLGLAVYVLAVQRRRAAAGAALSAATDLLSDDDVRRLALGDRVARMRRTVEGASREMVMRGAADATTPPEIADALCAYLVERWGVDLLERDARSHRSTRSRWRRMAALTILCRLGHPRRLDVLAAAADDADADVASVAFSLLGVLDDPHAGEILVRALTSKRHPAARIAVHLDRSPLPLADRLRPLVTDADPEVRFWAAALLGRYTDLRGLERELIPLTDDPDPRVRKAAIESLGRVGDGPAADAAVRLLQDPVGFVRANAVRALGKLDRPDLAGTFIPLLGDRDWWVRFAAKQTLETMGTEVWTTLVSCLNDADRFMRNGAAEVFQNLGLLDSLIVMEAASDDPAPQKIDMLRRIASAGGVRLTDSLVERAGPVVGPRVRSLLSVIGLEDVGAA